MYRSLLFRLHYEFPTNPSLKGTVILDPDGWWENEDRCDDLFEDPNKYGYVTTQLTHFPRCMGYDCGNLLSYLPIYDLQLSNKQIYLRKKFELTPRVVHANFFQQMRNVPFRDRSDSVVVTQRDCLNDPSVYVVNRKSLLINKLHVFYNDDSFSIHCVPLVRNSLKWSEGFLGDCMAFYAPCQYEEPIRSVALNTGWAKVAIFEFYGHYYWQPLFPTYDHL